MNNIYYTIGHSNRTIEEFIDILKHFSIEILVDVRTLPGSTKYSHFNKENLIKSLKKNKIDYIHIKELGGLRKNDKINKDINTYWQNKSFKNYADYAMSIEFKTGLNKLIELGDKSICAIMCAEVLWWRCHRRIITDYLIANKKKVVHIFNIKNTQDASINENAVLKKDVLIYK